MRSQLLTPILVAAMAAGGFRAAAAQCADPSLTGRVTMNGAPARGAVVAVYWAAPDSTLQVTRITADDDGVFRFCGRLPHGDFLVRGHVDGLASAPVRQRPPTDLPLRVDLSLDRHTVAFLPGYVTDASTGKPVEGALVRVRGADGWAISNGSGGFALRDVEVGVRRLIVSHIAFGSFGTDFLVGATADQLVNVAVNPTPLVLEPLTVTVNRRFTTPGMAAFYDRMERGTGYFVGREDIERRTPSTMLDLMRGIPGLRYYCARGECGITQDRARPCDMLLFVDGSPWDIRALDLFKPEDVEGVEVYLHVGQIPSRYRGAGADCGVVGIWLRPRRP